MLGCTPSACGSKRRQRADTTLRTRRGWRGERRGGLTGALANWPLSSFASGSVVLTGTVDDDHANGADGPGPPSAACRALCHWPECLWPEVENAVDLTEALRAAQRGDEAAMADLFRALNPPLLRYLGHRAPGAAEDLASECWLAVAKALTTFEGDSEDLRAWLFGVARRQVANFWRASRRGPVVVTAAEVVELPSVDAGEMVVEALSSQAAIEALLRGLPGDQAEILLLRVVAGLDVDQVAAVLGKRPGAVRVAQHRALRRLATRVERKAVTK